MADFQISNNKTSKEEGLYSVTPGDTGGETWKGIARLSHPKWAGWVIVDNQKKLPNFPYNLEQLTYLQKLVDDLKINKYWNVMRGDEIQSQMKADSLYDSCINMGPSRAIKLAQAALSIPQTGKMDNTTLNILNLDVIIVL